MAKATTLIVPRIPFPNPPPEANLGALVKIQQEAQQLDGIDEIAADGTIRFTERARGIMRTVFAYDCPELTPDAVEPRAEELLRALDDVPALA